LEEWQQVYSHLANNRVHAIVAEDSEVFNVSIGKTFSESSMEVYEKYRSLSLKHELFVMHNIFTGTS
jgi:hypothetical protein